jgi:SpoU rRNA methylase family enzyme
MLSTIFKVQGKSSVWIESLLSKKAIEMLKVGDEIIVEFGAKKFNSTVLQIASTLEGTSQSVKVLFNVPKEVMLMAGSKDMVKVFKATNTLYQVPKIAVTTIKTKEVVFVKVNGGFRIINLDVVHSDDNFFYIKNAINVPVAMNNIVILKNLVGGNDDK